MSNYLNFSVQTRDDLCNWMARSLGWPLLQVELTKEHFEDCIDEAMEEYTKFVAEEREYLALDLEQYDSLSGGFELPEYVTGVFAMESTRLGEGSTTIGSENRIWSLPNQLFNIPGYGGYGSDFPRTGSLITYEAALGFLDLMERMFATEFYMEYNLRSKRLKLTPDPIKYRLKGFVTVGVNVIREDDAHYGESWVKRYALAMAKIKLGTFRAKYGSSPLLGTGTVDTSMREEGIEERDDLKEELWKENNTPGFFIG